VEISTESPQEVHRRSTRSTEMIRTEEYPLYFKLSFDGKNPLVISQVDYGLVNFLTVSEILIVYAFSGTA
jgi:hypothetical protein